MARNKDGQSPTTDTNIIFEAARELAASTQGFWDYKGPGAGDLATEAFMRELRQRVHARLGYDCSEQKICGTNSFAVDFYVEKEGTIVEVAFSLRNPLSEFEKDILKALMAKEVGHRVDRLLFISRPGAIRRHSAPGSRSVIEWARRSHSLDIAIREVFVRSNENISLW